MNEQIKQSKKEELRQKQSERQRDRELSQHFLQALNQGVLKDK